MRRVGRLLLFLAVFILLAVLCVVGGMRFGIIPGLGGGAAQPAPEAPAVPTVEVVILAQPAKRGQRITEEMVALASVPEDMQVPTMLTNPDEAIGKLAARDLPQGIFLTQGDLVSDAAALFEGSGSIAAAQIPPGYVAISIPISRLTSVSYAIQPGDRVGIVVSFPFVDVDQEFQSKLPNLTASVIGNAVWVTGGEEGGGGVAAAETLQTFVQQVTSAGGMVGRPETQEEYNLYVIPSESQRPRLVTQLIIQDARVLHVGDFLAKPAQPLPQEGENQGEQPPQQEQQQQAAAAAPAPPDVVTLIVTPQDAVTIKYLLDRQMVLTLVLRGADDQSPLETEAVTLGYLLDEYRLVIPAKEAYDLEPRLDTVDWLDTFQYAPPVPAPEQ